MIHQLYLSFQKKSVQLLLYRLGEFKNKSSNVAPNSNTRNKSIKIVWASPSDDIEILPKSLANDFRTGKMIGNEIRYIKD